MVRLNDKGNQVKLFGDPVYHMRNLVRGQSLKPLQLPDDQMRAILNDPDRGIVTSSAAHGRVTVNKQIMPSMPGINLASPSRRRQKSVPVVERVFGRVYSPKNNGRAFFLLDPTLSDMKYSKTYDYKDLYKPKNNSQKVAIKINRNPQPIFYGTRIDFSLRERQYDSKRENSPPTDFEHVNIRTTQNAFLNKLNKQLSKIISPSSILNESASQYRTAKPRFPLIDTGITSTPHDHNGSTYYKYGPCSRAIEPDDEPPTSIIRHLSIDRQPAVPDREGRQTDSKAKFYMPAAIVKGDADRVLSLRSGYGDAGLSSNARARLQTESVAAYGVHCNLKRRVRLDSGLPKVCR